MGARFWEARGPPLPALGGAFRRERPALSRRELHFACLQGPASSFRDPNAGWQSQLQASTVPEDASTRRNARLVKVRAAVIRVWGQARVARPKPRERQRVVVVCTNERKDAGGFASTRVGFEKASDQELPYQKWYPLALEFAMLCRIQSANSCLPGHSTCTCSKKGFHT